MIFDLIAAGLLLAESKDLNKKILPSMYISQTINSSKTASNGLQTIVDRAEFFTAI